MVKALAWLYVLAVHLALIAIAVHDDLPRKVAARIGLMDAPDWTELSWLRAVQHNMDATVPAGAVIFLGDSITQSFATVAVAPAAVNYGIAGQRSDHLLRSMENYASMQRASAVVVMVGTNDVLQQHEDGLEARYRAILAKVPAGVPVVLSGIPPIAGKDVRPAVEAARRACSADPRCRFVDAGITPDMLTDGVHLGAEGYTVWGAALRTSLTGSSSPAGMTP